MLLVGACVLPLVLFSATLLVRNTAGQAEQTERGVRDRVRLLAEDVDREVGRVIAVAQALANSEVLLEGDLAAFYRYAAKIREQLGTNILVRDLTSQQLLNTRVPWGTPLPRNPVFEVDRAAIATGRPQVSGLLTGAVARAPQLIVVVPVLSDGTVRYLLSFTIAQERVQAIVSRERLPPGWVAGVVDRNGIIIARSERAEEVAGEPVPSDLWAGIQAAPEGIHRRDDLDGVPSLQAYSRSQASGWLIGVTVPEALVFAPMHQTLMLFAGGGLLLCATSIGVAVALGRRLSRPITRLAESAEALGAGAPMPEPVRGITEIEVVSGAMGAANDLIRKRTAALAESEARLRAVVEGAPFPVMVHAEDGRVVHVSQAWFEETGYTPEEIATTADWARRAYGERQRAIASDIERLYALDRAIDEGEYAVRTADGRTRNWAFRTAPIGRDADGRRLVVTMAVDLTERKQAEERLRLLMREVDHRAKNALAVVQSIVLLSRAESRDDFAEAVQGRIGAMARAHTLLATARWSGADLAEMVHEELKAHAHLGRVRIAGPAVAIAAEAVQAISMILHELTTNASKHGALSIPAGHVAVSWSIAADPGPLILEWQEGGGPSVVPPTRYGFGTALLEQTIEGQLRGVLIRDWHPAGLRCRIELPRDCFAVSGLRPPAQCRTDPANDHREPPRPWVRAPCILVVEDEALTAVALAHVLRDGGYRVLGPVGRVQEAIDLARATPPDAAVLDVSLFGQSSFAVAEALHAMGVPFLFCTGYENLEGRGDRLRSAPVLTKPVSPEYLIQTVSRLLASGGRPATAIVPAP